MSKNKNSKDDEKKTDKYSSQKTNLDLHQIKRDIDKIQKELGIIVDNKCQAKGENSLIYYAEKNRNLFAVKVINKIPFESSEDKKRIKQEMLIASNVKNKNCIRCVATSEQEGSRIIVSERAINKDIKYLLNLFTSGRLFHFLRYKKTDLNGRLNSNFMFHLSESFIRFFINQILSGIDYLHSLYYVHGDIKLENILIMVNFEVKITDFSETRAVSASKDFKSFLAPNIHYAPPECFDDKIIPSRHAFKIDTYALGMILYKMMFNEFINEDPACSDPKLDPENKKKFLNNLELKLKKFSTEGIEFLKDKNRPKEMISKDLIDLQKKTLEVDFYKRGSINEIANMKWAKKNTLQLKKLHEIHDNDFIKFLLELQKMDSIGYYQNKQNWAFEKSRKPDITKVNFINLKNKIVEPNLSKKRERSTFSKNKINYSYPHVKSKIRIV
jgi:serine/threonine protein kinase